MGSNLAVYWMDVSDASYYMSIEKKKNKGSQMGHTKKYLKKNLLFGNSSSCMAWNSLRVYLGNRSLEPDPVDFGFRFF